LLLFQIGFERLEKRQPVKGAELADFKVQIPQAPGSLILYYQKKD